MYEPLLSLFSSKGEEAHSPSTQTSHNEQCLHDHVLAAPSLSQSTSSYINLVANLSIKKRKIAHRSRSAPTVLVTDAGIDFDEPSEPISIQNGLVEYICDAQEAFTLSMIDENRYERILWTYIVDEEKGRMRIRTKVSLALVVVIGCITIGAVTAHFLEVGYRDYSFKTVTGRCFAIIWLLVSTLAVARAFLYLTDYSMHKRKRKMAKLVLHKKITLSDLVAADLDNDGSISPLIYGHEQQQLQSDDALRATRSDEPNQQELHLDNNKISHLVMDSSIHPVIGWFVEPRGSNIFTTLFVRKVFRYISNQLVAIPALTLSSTLLTTSPNHHRRLPPGPVRLPSRRASTFHRLASACDLQSPSRAPAFHRRQLLPSTIWAFFISVAGAYQLLMHKVRLFYVYGSHLDIDVKDFRNAKPNILSRYASKIPRNFNKNYEHALKTLWKKRGLDIEGACFIGIYRLCTDVRVFKGTKGTKHVRVLDKCKSSTFGLSIEDSDFLLESSSGTQLSPVETARTVVEAHRRAALVFRPPMDQILGNRMSFHILIILLER
ncbi:hypothetical protein PIB30_022063 [Stylosanthes scabra]|uniref:Uncharacterized protein n=1 Tax=Stylosanthes scabra TaxID=79078 RepID=A0ABU6Z5V8_9FABA|nr:hypothetical protein [Stylosanthes scabra]